MNKNDDSSKTDNCCVCYNKITDTKTSINHKELKKPAHFDCIIKEIEQYEELSDIYVSTASK